MFRLSACHVLHHCRSLLSGLNKITLPQPHHFFLNIKTFYIVPILSNIHLPQHQAQSNLLVLHIQTTFQPLSSFRPCVKGWSLFPCCEVPSALAFSPILPYERWEPALTVYRTNYSILPTENSPKSSQNLNKSWTVLVSRDLQATLLLFPFLLSFNQPAV